MSTTTRLTELTASEWQRQSGSKLPLPNSTQIGRLWRISAKCALSNFLTLGVHSTPADRFRSLAGPEWLGTDDH